MTDTPTPERFERDELVDLLHEVAGGVNVRDVFEGTITWMPATDAEGEYDVTARYRTTTGTVRYGESPKAFDEMGVRRLIVYVTKFLLYHDMLLERGDTSPHHAEMVQAVDGYRTQMRDALHGLARRS